MLVALVSLSAAAGDAAAATKCTETNGCAPRLGWHERSRSGRPKRDARIAYRSPRFRLLKIPFGKLPALVAVLPQPRALRRKLAVERTSGLTPRSTRSAEKAEILEGESRTAARVIRVRVQMIATDRWFAVELTLLCFASRTLGPRLPLL